MDVEKRELTFSVQGEFITNIAREWFYLEGKPFDKVMELLMDCMSGTDETEAQIKRHPGDSEFVKAGLSYTTDPTTHFIGFHAQGTYERAISDLYAIMGLRLFCEYLDAIAYISVGGADTQTLGKLTVTAAEGSETGKTKISVKEQLMSMKNCWKYKDAASATAVKYGDDVKNWSKWDGESEIASTAGHHITLVECDQNYKAVRSGDVTVAVKS